jgi:light-regulated signal transduction histidine kinase (bacteriophytochrome)
MPPQSEFPCTTAADDFLVGGGIMGELIRSKDWSATPLGPKEEPLRMVAIYTQLLKKKYGGQLDSQSNEIIQGCVDGAVRNTLENLKVSMEETHASITCSPLPTLQVQAVHLRQILQNLVGNALKYRSERRPEIQVNARREGREWIISVQDNGIGIAPHYQEQIFGLFKRLHSGDRYSGTGLGLAICRKLLERYGGRIWLESESGEGSIFFFTLPAEEDA